MEEILVKLPTVDSIGLMKAKDGPPLPRELDIKWPRFIRDFANEHWPGVPIPRKWGEETVKKLPLGLGVGVLKVIDTFGL